MNTRLSHELHAMVDDTVGVNLVDDALRHARAIRRRRSAVGVGAVAAVAAAIVVPATLAGGRPSGSPIGRPPSPSPSLSDVCEDGRLVIVTPAADPLSGVRAIVGGHLPAGYRLDTTDAYTPCGSDPLTIADYRMSKVGTPGAPGVAEVDALTVTRVSRTDRTDGLADPVGGAIISTRCADLLQPAPSVSPVDPAPSLSYSDAPTPNPLASSGAAHVVSCTDGTLTTPMVYVVARGPSLTAGAVYPDHHAVVARAIDQPALTASVLLAIATDPRLSPPVTMN